MTPSMISTGWFQVAWSADVAVGDVKAARYFGTDLVLYRGLDEVVRAHDRYCQHLGGNLAQGGTVVDKGLRCPVHGWIWGTDGHNVEIPYQDRPNAVRKVRAWPTHEGNSAIYLWHDAEGRAPRWEIPDYLTALGPHFSGRAYHPVDPPARSHFPELHVAPQLVAENAVGPHGLVRGTPVSPVVVEEHVEGPTWQAKVDTLTLIFWGLGVSANGELTHDGARVISICTTPVDDLSSEIFATYWIERKDPDPPGAFERRVDEAKRALPDEITGWHQQICPGPSGLATSDAAGLRKLRRWSRQFYPDHERAPAGQ